MVFRKKSLDKINQVAAVSLDLRKELTQGWGTDLRLIDGTEDGGLRITVGKYFRAFH